MMVSIRFMNMEGIYMQIRLKDLKRVMARFMRSTESVCYSLNPIYGIIGKSGAGKSTLVRLITLLKTGFR